MHWNNKWSDIDKKREAIRSISHSLKFHSTNESLNITWCPENTESLPTDAEIQAEIVRLQNEYTSLQYSRDRASSYPSIGDQLDMLWHAIDTNTLDKTSDFYNDLKEVKAKHPKEQ
jgi:hypothetical protein